MRLLRAFFLIAVFLTTGVVRCASTVIQGELVSLDDAGLTLKVGEDTVVVAVEKSTRWWQKARVAEPKSFAPGMSIRVRAKAGAEEPVALEVADLDSAPFLDRVRKESMRGKLVESTAKTVTIGFPEGREFTYRWTAKTRVELGGRVVPLLQIAAGTEVYVRGRLLPSYDTWAISLTDQPPLPTPSRSKGPKVSGKPKLKPIPDKGALEGEVTKHTPSIRMFDLRTSEGRSLHITYRAATSFTLDTKPAKPGDLLVDMRAKIAYQRDKLGRIMASRVELFSGPARLTQR